MKKTNGKTYHRGDILLIQNRWDIIGYLIRLITKSDYNHVAWIINNYYLIEALGRGIVINPISKYHFKWLYKTKIIRIKQIDPVALKLALNQAIAQKQQEKWAYIKLLGSFLGILLGFKGFRPTCSGLIAQSLYSVGFKFNNKKPYKITPQDIYESKYTRPI